MYSSKFFVTGRVITLDKNCSFVSSIGGTATMDVFEMFYFIDPPPDASEASDVFDTSECCVFCGYIEFSDS